MISTAQLRSQPFWFNSLIRIENKPVYFKLWATNGIQTISNLMTNDGTYEATPKKSKEMVHRLHVRTK